VPIDSTNGVTMMTNSAFRRRAQDGDEQYGADHRDRERARRHQRRDNGRG
jgi:hypothetical protein